MPGKNTYIEPEVRSNSPVEYEESGNYYIREHIELTHEQIQKAEQQAKKDAQNNPFDIKREKTTEYERIIRRHWGGEIIDRSGNNIGRLRKWSELIRRELNDLNITKMEYTEMLKNRKYKLTDRHLKTLPYIIILALITAVEMPINITVFDIFGESVIFTFLLGGILSILLALIAHFVGGWIKAEGLKIRSLGFIVAVVLLVGIIAWIRVKFFSNVEYSVIQDFFKTDMEIGLLIGLFFILNVLLFSISTGSAL